MGYHKWTRPEVEKIRAMKKSGLTCMEISQSIGTSYATAVRLVYRLDIIYPDVLPAKKEPKYETRWTRPTDPRKKAVCVMSESEFQANYGISRKEFLLARPRGHFYE